MVAVLSPYNCFLKKKKGPVCHFHVYKNRKQVVCPFCSKIQRGARVSWLVDRLRARIGLLALCCMLFPCFPSSLSCPVQIKSDNSQKQSKKWMKVGGQCRGPKFGTVLKYQQLSQILSCCPENQTN